MVFSKIVYTAGPNTALIKSSGRRDVRIVIGGRIVAVPVFQRVDRLSLELRTIQVRTHGGMTSKGIKVDVNSCCQVKIQGWSAIGEPEREVTDLHTDLNAVKLAAQHFIGKSDAQMEEAIQRTLEGHQRAIIGTLTVEELYSDRAAFSHRVLELAFHDMRNMGLFVVSYTVSEIVDSVGYIDSIGVAQNELVHREAAEGSAVHQSKAKAKRAKEDANAHLLVNEEERRKAISDKERRIAAAEAQTEVERKLAVQAKASSISLAEEDAKLLVMQQKAKAAEAKEELNVEREKVHKQRLIMEQKIHTEADAKLYQAKVNAEAIRVTATAEAERIRLVGKAEADALRAKYESDMAALERRVEIWNGCTNQTALVERALEVLPQLAAAIAEPLKQTDKMVFVGSGSGGGGPSAYAREFERMAAEIPETIPALTGFDVRKAIAHLAGVPAADHHN